RSLGHEEAVRQGQRALRRRRAPEHGSLLEVEGLDASLRMHDVGDGAGDVDDDAVAEDGAGRLSVRRESGRGKKARGEKAVPKAVDPHGSISVGFVRLHWPSPQLPPWARTAEPMLSRVQTPRPSRPAVSPSPCGS